MLDLASAGGSPLTVHRSAQVPLELEGETVVTDVTVASDLTAPAILGLDFLQSHGASIDCGTHQVHLKDAKRSIPLRRCGGHHSTFTTTMGVVSSTVQPRAEDGARVRKAHPTDPNTGPLPGDKQTLEKSLVGSKERGRQFKPGDMVCLRHPDVEFSQARKLHCPWTGPFRIVQKLSDMTYRMQNVWA